MTISAIRSRHPHVECILDGVARCLLDSGGVEGLCGAGGFAAQFVSIGVCGTQHNLVFLVERLDEL